MLKRDAGIFFFILLRLYKEFQSEQNMADEVWLITLR